MLTVAQSGRLAADRGILAQVEVARVGVQLPRDVEVVVVVKGSLVVVKRSLIKTATKKTREMEQRKRRARQVVDVMKKQQRKNKERTRKRRRARQVVDVLVVNLQVGADHLRAKKGKKGETI